MTERRKYESPIVMPLGGLSRGEGGCNPGTGDGTGCVSGNNAAFICATGDGFVVPEPICQPGSAAFDICLAGGAATVACSAGGLPQV